MDPAELFTDPELADRINQWDQNRATPGSLAHEASANLDLPGADGWAGAIGGVQGDAGQLIGRLWAVEQPPADVIDALRSFFLWWGTPTPEPHAEPDDRASFLDEQPVDFNRRETQQFVRILADGYYDPESMIGLADRAGLSVSEIDLSGRPTATASSMIRVASRHRRLRQLAEVMLADDHLGTLQLDLRVLLDDEGGTEQPSLG